MVRRIWTHQDIRAAMERQRMERSRRLTRRGLMKSVGATAGAAMVMPFFPNMARAAVGGDLQIMLWEGYDSVMDIQDWMSANNVDIDVSIITTQDDVQAKFLGGSRCRST